MLFFLKILKEKGENSLNPCRIRMELIPLRPKSFKTNASGLLAQLVRATDS